MGAACFHSDKKFTTLLNGVIFLERVFGLELFLSMDQIWMNFEARV